MSVHLNWGSNLQTLPRGTYIATRPREQVVLRITGLTLSLERDLCTPSGRYLQDGTEDEMEVSGENRPFVSLKENSSLKGSQAGKHVAFPYGMKGLRDTVACDQMTTGGNHLGRERGLDKHHAPEAREEGKWAKGKEEAIRTMIRSEIHREREKDKWLLG